MQDAFRYDRAVGAILGLACGDSYGAPLEFVKQPRVREKPVDISPGVFRWTDDTHMSLYLGKAILDLPPGSRNMSYFGKAIAARWIEWLRDPLTPHTAPGNTCLTAAHALAAGRGWEEAGVVHSDGCGAVMRILPIAIAFSGDVMLDAADVSARTTHGHPNAREAAMAGTWLVHALMGGRILDEQLVTEAMKVLQGRNLGGTVVTSLADALQHIRGLKLSNGQWIEDGAIHPGDGGWRSGSALGLAIVAAIRWGQDLATVVEKAARINGDSDSVACLAGMLVGAQTGRAGIPAPWRAAVQDREQLEQLAGDLIQWNLSGKNIVTVQEQVPASKLPRTSQTDPIQVAFLPLKTQGRVGVTFAPGKKSTSFSGSPWDRDLNTDLDRLKAMFGVDLLCPLIEDHELQDMQILNLMCAAEERGIVVARLPIPDGGTPNKADAEQLVRLAASFIRAGKTVVFHCKGGLGRAGTLAACTASRFGLSSTEAIQTVRSVRPGAIENSAQEGFIRAFSLK